jgi:hypothetical protein
MCQRSFPTTIVSKNSITKGKFKNSQILGTSEK